MWTACDRFAQLLPVGVGQQHDGFIAVVHAAVGETGLVVEDERIWFLPGMSNAVTTANSLQSMRGSKWMERMIAAGNGAAHRGAVPHAFELEVVEIAGAARAACPRPPCGGRIRQQCGFSRPWSCGEACPGRTG